MAGEEETTTDASAKAAANGQFEQIELESPIVRGKQTIGTITLRKPKAGELRGTSLIDLMRMETDALVRVIPRISDPVLTSKELDDMEPADLTQIASAVAGFLLPKQAKLDSAS